MKRAILVLICFCFIISADPMAELMAQQEDEEPVTVAYFYKARWGHHDEFVDLYRKNHYPVMKALVESGHLLEVKTFTPRFHGDGRSDWTFLAVLVFRDWQAMQETGAEEEKIVRRLYPDQETFQQEERRRFEILEAHWDTPLSPSPME